MTMASSSARFFLRRVPGLGLPTLAAIAIPRSTPTSCDSGPANSPELSGKKEINLVDGSDPHFHNLFPSRQLWQPKKEYPLWDSDWDGKQPQLNGTHEENRRLMREIRKTGVTRHIILVRHGQYDETAKEDSKRILTPLGRKQAELTGERLREMLDGVNKEFGPCNIKVVRVSDMARAKETADIIASHLPGVDRANPDPDLNEGRPAHNIPGGKASSSTIEKMDENHPRIERAFQRCEIRWRHLLMHFAPLVLHHN